MQMKNALEVSKIIASQTAKQLKELNYVSQRIHVIHHTQAFEDQEDTLFLFRNLALRCSDPILKRQILQMVNHMIARSTIAAADDDDLIIA